MVHTPLSYEMLARELQEQFYASVPFPIGRSQIQEAVQAFFAFLEAPAPIKEHMGFSIAPEHRRGDVGYKKRSADDHVYNDDKEFFHYHPALFEKYADFMKEAPVVAAFAQKAHPLWEAAAQVMGDILRAFEPHFPGVYDRVFDTPCPHVVLRFLRYDWHACGKYLAKPHFDAGSFTLGIGESCAGLRIGSGPQNLRLVQHQKGKAVFMLSGNVGKVMTSTELLPGWHDVIQLNQTFLGRPFSRWAVVAFVDAHGVETLPSHELRRFYDTGSAALDTRAR